jgi:hypothetical protein
MRFSFAIVLAVVAAVASSTSAVPVDAAAEKCHYFCKESSQCTGCVAEYCVPVSFSG